MEKGDSHAHFHIANRPSLRRSLLLAALACILRPTDLLIWGCLGSFLAIRNPYKIHLLLRDAISCGYDFRWMSIADEAVL